MSLGDGEHYVDHNVRETGMGCCLGIPGFLIAAWIGGEVMSPGITMRVLQMMHDIPQAVMATLGH